MDPATIALIHFAVKFGIDAAIALAKGLQGGATIEQAIAALEVAKTKTAEQYLADADAQLQAATAILAPVAKPTPDGA